MSEYGGTPAPQPAGWYPEPGTGYLRWWDGYQWGPYQQAPVPPSGGKDRTVAGVLGILLGGLGVHKFYLGRTNAGIIMLVGSLVGACCGAILIIPLLVPMAFGVIGLVEGIIYLTKSDQEFQQTYVQQGRDWF
jgi:TM2 domain-containing membrane protein YozV